MDYKLIEEKNLAFLISAPRAGSTVLAHTLGRSKMIYSESEPWLMLGLSQFGRIDINHEFGSWHVARAIDDFLGSNRMMILSAVARLIYNLKLPKGKSVFLDKTPRYFWILDQLKEMFPGAKFIILHRNPLDVAASFKTAWGLELQPHRVKSNPDHLLLDFFIGVEAINKWSEAMCSDTNVVTVEYEHFIEEPVRVVWTIFQRLSWDPTGIDFSDIARIEVDSLSPGRFGDKNIQQTAEIHRESKERWRTVLDDGEAAFVASYFGLRHVEGLREGRVEEFSEATLDLKHHVDASLQSKRSRNHFAYTFDMNSPKVDARLRTTFEDLLSITEPAGMAKTDPISVKRC